MCKIKHLCIYFLFFSYNYIKLIKSLTYCDEVSQFLVVSSFPLIFELAVRSLLPRRFLGLLHGNEILLFKNI